MKKVNYESEWDFVNDVAEDCIQKLDVEQREMLINHPRAIDYHFAYCMYIRNHYIHGTDFSDVPFYVEPDDLSAKVMKMILAKLLPEEYLYEDFFTEMLYGHRGFIKLRQEYKKLYGEYPVELVRKYREEMSREQIEEQVESISGETIDTEKWHNDFLQKYEKCKAVINCIIEELLEMVWCTEQFLKMASGCGVAYEEIFPKIEEMKQIFLEEGMYIPVEICLLPYEKQIGQERYLAYRNVLCEQLEDNPRLIEKLDEAYFKDRALAKVVLKYAWALEYLPLCQDAHEII